MRVKLACKHIFELGFSSDANPMLLDGRQFVKKIAPGFTRK